MTDARFMELVFIPRRRAAEGKLNVERLTLTPYTVSWSMLPQKPANIGLHASRSPPVAEIPVMNRNLARYDKSPIMNDNPFYLYKPPGPFWALAKR